MQHRYPLRTRGLVQPEVNYGVLYKNVYILARRDGIVVQDSGKTGEMDGYNDANEVPDRAAAESAVQVAAELYGRMRTTG